LTSALEVGNNIICRGHIFRPACSSNVKSEETMARSRGKVVAVVRVERERGTGTKIHF
jgi:hypothetical protein